MKITTPNFNIECTIDELKAMEQCGILAMICQPEPTPAIPFPLPEMPTAGGTKETVAKTDIPDENTTEIATVEVKPEKEKKPRRPRKGKAVEMKTKSGWVKFDSINEAVKETGYSKSSIYKAIVTGEKWKDHEFRYYQEPTEFDKCLREIEERNRQPYEPTPPIR